MKILAPVKNLEAGLLAVNIKADELYVAGPGFSARHDAANSWADLKQIIDYAHLYDVKVYITVNILINQRNLKTTIQYCEQLLNLLPDALIIQDLGLLRILSEKYPTLLLHASTQLHTHNFACVGFLANYQVSRCVLARETNLSDIKTIKNKYPNIELEVFIHGALCISYSGQCYYGTYYQQGSGNFGTCEQYCRLKHQTKKTDLALNLKDLALLDEIMSLKNYVSSLKIEGRLKSLEYLYSSVLFYQKMLDNTFDNEMFDLMQVAFNREYTKGYLKQQDLLHNKNRVNNTGLYIGTIIKADQNDLYLKTNKKLHRLDNIRVIANNQETGLVIERIDYLNDGIVKINNKNINKGDVYLVKTRAYEKDIALNSKLYQRKITKNMNIEVIIDAPLKVIIDNKTYLSDFIVTKALNKPFNHLEITKQMSKTQSTPYEFNIHIQGDQDVFIVKSQLNQFRRDIIESLIIEQLTKPKLITKPYTLTKTSEIETKGVLWAISNLNQARVLSQAKITSVYVHDLPNLSQYQTMFEEVIPVLPRVIKNTDIDNYLKLINDFPRVMVSELGMLHLLNKKKIIDVNYSLNIINNEALKLMSDYQVQRVIIGLDAQDSIKIPEIETIQYAGHFPLMIMNEDIAPETNITNHKKDKLIKYDNNGTTELLSSKPYQNTKIKTNYIFINLTIEDEKQTQTIINKGGYYE